MGAKLVTMTALRVVAFPGVRVYSYAYSRVVLVVLGILVTENVATTTLATVTYKALFLDQVV